MTVTVSVVGGYLTQFARYAVENLDILPRQAGTRIIFEIK